LSTFGLLLLPAANRVYGKASLGLLRAEVSVVLGDRISDVADTVIGGVPYVTFSADEPPAGVADLSGAYALFELVGDGLKPVEIGRRDRFDDDLLTIQRYQGKTNEQFTKLMVNVTLAVSASITGERLPRLLDPLCGRGTSLNQALIYGFEAAGIELDGRAVDAYESFLTTWLQNKRLKHKVEKSRFRRDGKIAGRRFDINGSVRCSVVHDDTRFVGEHFHKPEFDALVADLPYGVQHTRRPLSLLEEALPAWIRVLRPGAGIGLAFNTRISKRADIVSTLEGAGLRVLDDGPFLEFEHRVDQAIQRDLVVAQRPLAG
jgi:SAM-dependent methyltransferase